MASKEKTSKVRYQPTPKKETAHKKVAPEAALKKHHKGHIPIRYIEDAKKRSRTLSDRKSTLFKSAKDLCDLTGVDIQLSLRNRGVEFVWDSKNPSGEKETPPAVPVPVPSGSADLGDPELSPRRMRCTAPSSRNVTSTATQCSWGNILQGVDTSEQCRVCGGRFDDDPAELQALWMGCDEEECNHWLHSFCIGFSKSVSPKLLQKLEWKCPQHRQ